MNQEHFTVLHMEVSSASLHHLPERPWLAGFEPLTVCLVVLASITVPFLARNIETLRITVAPPVVCDMLLSRLNKVVNSLLTMPYINPRIYIYCVEALTELPIHDKYIIRFFPLRGVLILSLWRAFDVSTRFKPVLNC